MVRSWLNVVSLNRDFPDTEKNPLPPTVDGRDPAPLEENIQFWLDIAAAGPLLPSTVLKRTYNHCMQETKRSELSTNSFENIASNLMKSKYKSTRADAQRHASVKPLANWQN